MVGTLARVRFNHSCGRGGKLDVAECGVKDVCRARLEAPVALARGTSDDVVLVHSDREAETVGISTRTDRLYLRSFRGCSAVLGRLRKRRGVGVQHVDIVVGAENQRITRRPRRVIYLVGIMFIVLNVQI